MFYVVEFKNENSIETIPVEWMSDNYESCLWPPKEEEVLTFKSRFTGHPKIPDKETWVQ